MLNRFLKIQFFFLVFLFSLPSTSLFSQVPAQAEIQKELNRRDIDQIELESRLRLKGFDLNNIDPTDPGQVKALESAVKEVVDEMEAEKEKESKETQTRNDSVPVQKDEPRIAEQIDTVFLTEDKTTPSQVSEQELPKNVDLVEIQKAIEEGATLEEAIAEQISKQKEKKLPPPKTWGQQIFRDKNISIYRQSEDVKPPNSYILGVGDYITVSIWGYSQDNIVFEINSEGYIKPERMPRIYLKGITLGKARALLRNRFAEYYRFRPEEFELTLNFARTITINVVGEVFDYGSYTIPAINTAFNALVAAGGPTDIGSVRNIKLHRAGQTPRNIDVYKFLLNPATQEELFLEENDFIHVPIAERVVQILGAVNRPNRYELIEGENLIELIKYAGGLKDDGLRGNIQIKRIVNDKEVIVDANLTELKSRNENFTLFPSDVVTINTINKGIDDYVNISGAVEFPDRYSYTEGMKISDLIKKAVLKIEARKDVAFLQRTNVDGTVEYVKIELGEILENPNSERNLLLKTKDRLIIYSLSKFTDKRSIRIKGNVRTPGVFPYDMDDSLKVSDLILLGDGLNPNAAQFGYIKRFDVTNKEVKDYIKIDIFEVVSSPNSISNIKIEPFDELTVFKNESYTDENKVSISGAVRKPSSFDFSGGMRVSDLIYLAEGIKPDATSFAFIFRESLTKEKEIEYVNVNVFEAIKNPGGAQDLLLLPGDDLKTYSRTVFQDSISVTIGGAVRVPGEYSYDESLQLKDIITMAGGLKINAAKNKIDVFRIEFNENKPTKTVAMTVEVDSNFEPIIDGGFKIAPFDQIVVRKVPDFEFQRSVIISGEVNYPGVYAILNEDEPISSLVERAGGVTEFSFPEGATLKRLQDSIGYVIIELDKVLKNKNSKHNIILKARDEIFIPKQEDIVSITGATNTKDLYKADVLQGNKINVPFDGGKRAMYYIRNHAGGINKDGAKRNITVKHPNGETKRTKNYILFKLSPKVRPGSKINVGLRELKEEEIASDEKEKVDWDVLFEKTIVQVTSVLTLILLLQRLN